MKRKNSFLNILYPRHCPWCHEILKDQRSLICPECARMLTPIRGSRCMKCGHPVKEQEEFCGECLKRTHEFTAGCSVFLYNEGWKNSIERYKYFGCREYGDYYAACMSTLLKEKQKIWKVQRIVPVPMYWRKERMRGFNQSWHLARMVGEQLSIPADNKLVRKIRNTKSQKKLTAEERMQNLSRAFEARERIPGEHVLVVDDMYTTGSTIDAMAVCLRKAGAEKVYFLTLCMGVHPGGGEA